MSNEILKILLVEDDETYHMLFKKILETAPNSNFELVREKQLALGLERISQEKFEAILLDLNLSDSSGMDTFMQMKYVARSTPIVILTATDELAINALQEGVQDYLVKGQDDFRILPRVIRYAIERKRTEERLKSRTQELEELNRLMVDRELKMIELKRELDDLTRQAEA